MNWGQSLGLCTIVLWASCVLASPPVYQVVDLGPVSSTGDGAYGVNELGQVVGYSENTAYLWEGGSFTWHGLDYDSKARAINNNGRIAGTLNNKAVIWDSGVPTYLMSGNRDGHAHDVNSHGVVTGYYEPYVSPSYQGFIWEDGVATPVVNPHGNRSTAYAINDSNQVVGDAWIPDGSERGFIWTDGAMTFLPVLDGYDRTYARDVNDQGQVLAYSQQYVYDRGYIWQDGVVTAELLYLPGGATATPNAINNHAQVVGNAATNGPYYDHAFLWESGTITDLNDLLPVGSNWVLMDALDISDMGWIVGTGTYEGDEHAFLLIPEPTSLALTAFVGVAILRRRRNR